MNRTLVLLLLCASLPAWAARNPNIVVILADDMGWGDVGYHGCKDIRTPHIDRLAREGTWFRQGYVTASVCAPSRAGLVSGVYQQRFGFLGNGERFFIPLDQPTLAERLKARGYRTGMIGKWHVGQEEKHLPNARGFDFYYGSTFGSHDYFRSSTDPDTPKRGLLPIYRNSGIEPPIQERGGYLTDIYTDEALGFIEQSKDAPFFLYVSHNAVHYPWQADPEDIERLKDLPVHHEDRRFYAAMVLALDDGVGRIVECLKKNDLERDTLVFFLTDNGATRGQGIEDPGRKKNGKTVMSSPGPLHGFKGDPYEGGTRIPFVMCWPGKVPAGQAYPHPVISLDIAATAMACSTGPDLEQGLPLDGVNLLPYVRGENDGRPHEILYWRRGGDYAVRKGDWKLLFGDSRDGIAHDRIELYNLAEDPNESKDLVDSQPERARTLQDLFDAWDGGLPDSMAGNAANPVNRNRRYARGHRVDIPALNAAARKRTEENGLPFAQYMAESRAKKNFNEKTCRSWFTAKDLNDDGVISGHEMKLKPAKDWRSY